MLKMYKRKKNLQECDERGGTRRKGEREGETRRGARGKRTNAYTEKMKVEKAEEDHEKQEPSTRIMETRTRGMNKKRRADQMKTEEG